MNTKTVTSSLCQNGIVLTGQDLERYSKRKGLCHICARVETHKRVGKLLKRNQWDPLTIQNPNTGEYDVYKGYCIQPTCYTLEQAKEMLGEKPASLSRSSLVRGSTADSRASVSSSTSLARKNTEVLPPTAPITPKRSTPPVTWKREQHNQQRQQGSSSCLSIHSAYVPTNISRRRGSQTSIISSCASAQRRGSHQQPQPEPQQRRVSTNNHTSDGCGGCGGGRWSPTGSITSLTGSVSSAMAARHKWSREFPPIRLPLLDTTDHKKKVNEDEDKKNAPHDSVSRTVTNEVEDGGGISQEMLLDDFPDMTNKTTATISNRGAQSAEKGHAAGGKKQDCERPRKENKFRRLVASLQGDNGKCQKTGIANIIGKESMTIASSVSSSASVSSSSELSASSISSFASTLTHPVIQDPSHVKSMHEISNQKRRSTRLPGSGFVMTATEGNYRAALEALDLAGAGPTNSTRSNIVRVASGDTSSVHQHQQLQALCLQSTKHLDHLDIEMVAVPVDSLNRQWLNQEFLLDDEESVAGLNSDDRRGQKMVFDLTGAQHLVRLSHLCFGEIEELELEAASLSQCYHGEEIKADSESSIEDDPEYAKELLFETRASLEAEITRCEMDIRLAEQSDDTDYIHKGITARKKLDQLIPLRKDHTSKRDLQKKLKKLTKMLQQTLESTDLGRRYKLATEKEHLTSQLRAEMTELKRQERRLLFQEPESKNPDDSIQKNVDTDSKLTATRTATLSPRLPPLSSEQSPSFSIPNVTEKVDADPSINNELDGNMRNVRRNIVEVHMTVFQSAPLAYVDPATGTHHVCPLLDFEYEARALMQALRDAETTGAKIDVEFDIATTDRLSAFLARSESRVMHLSCHGHAEYLALENGFGGMQVLPVRDLKRFIGAGAGNLEVVFVSACHSKAAGKAFLDAGIRHVICCRQDDKFRDEGAIEFARSFYRALALNNTLKQAFKMAREAMRVSPMVKDSKAEYEKFILLPELPESDPYHDVHVFRKSKQRFLGASQKSEPRAFRSSRILPRTPKSFIGRESDMYMVLDALRSNDVVHITGDPEVGKASLVAATCRYIDQRQKSFLFDELFWLPVQEEAIHSDDALYLDLSRIVDMITKAVDLPCQLKREYAEHWGKIVRQVHDKRILLVIYVQHPTSETARKSLDYFLRDLLRVSSAKVITVGVPKTEASPLDSTIVNIEALDYESAVLLFARLCKSTSTSAQQIVSTLNSIPKSQQGLSIMSWRRNKIYKKIGSGIPSAVKRAAMDMPDDVLSELLSLSKRPCVEVSSRVELEDKIKNLEDEETQQLREKEYLVAKDTHETIEELQSLRPKFPILQELKDEENKLIDALQVAISFKQYENANQIQQNLKTLQHQISKEIKHMNFLKTGETLPSF